MGISGRLLALFVDYLKDRHQRVVIRGQQSEISQIKVWVPQGSDYLLMKLLYTYIEIDNQNDTSKILNKDLETWGQTFNNGLTNDS